jgi:hypothetical protein
MVVTEVEYILSVCRSIFDSLQLIISRIWSTIVLIDPLTNKKPLKESFARVVLHDDKPSTASQIAQRFGLPYPLAEVYARQSDFFLKLRKFRDSIVHHGSRVQTIFVAEKGFLIANYLKPFSDMKIWYGEEKEPNGLVPLRPALGAIIYQTLSACEEFAIVTSKIVQFPLPVVPGMKLFVRGYFNDQFAAILQNARERMLALDP